MIAANRTRTFIYKVTAHGTCPATVIRVDAEPNGCGETPQHHRATFINMPGEWVALMACDGCDKRYRVRPTMLRGKVNTSKGCNARCMAATSSDCECECGGERHGINHA